MKKIYLQPGEKVFCDGCKLYWDGSRFHYIERGDSIYDKDGDVLTPEVIDRKEGLVVRWYKEKDGK